MAGLEPDSPSSASAFVPAARKLLAAGGAAAEETAPPARSPLRQVSAAEATARAATAAAKAAAKAARPPALRAPAVEAEAEPPQESPPKAAPVPVHALKHSSRLFEFKDLLASPPPAAATSPPAAEKGSRKRLKRKGSPQGVAEGAGGWDGQEAPATAACRSSKRARRTPGAWWQGGEFTWERNAPPS